VRLRRSDPSAPGLRREYKAMWSKARSMGGDLGVAGRNETDAERVGRNWNELLQELTGVSFEPTGTMGVHWTWGLRRGREGSYPALFGLLRRLHEVPECAQARVDAAAVRHVVAVVAVVAVRARVDRVEPQARQAQSRQLVEPAA